MLLLGVERVVNGISKGIKCLNDIVLVLVTVVFNLEIDDETFELNNNVRILIDVHSCTLLPVPLISHSKMTSTRDHWNSYPQVVDLVSIRKVYLPRQDVMVVIQ